MAKIIIDVLNGVDLHEPHMRAASLSADIVHEMAKWFKVETTAKLSRVGDQKIITFTFESKYADRDKNEAAKKAAAENVRIFIKNHADLQDAFIPRSEVERLAGSTSIKMDLDTLSEIKPDKLKTAASAAAIEGSSISHHVSRNAGRSKA